MKRFSLRTVFFAVCLFGLLFAGVRFAMTNVPPFRVRSDRADVIVYIDHQPLGSPPAAMSWERLWAICGTSGTTQLDQDSFSFTTAGTYLRLAERADGSYPFIYLKPLDASTAEKRGLYLMDSPFGKVVETSCCSWDEQRKSLIFLAYQIKNPSNERPRISRASIGSDRQVQTEVRIPAQPFERWEAGNGKLHLTLHAYDFRQGRNRWNSKTVALAELRRDGDALSYDLTVDAAELEGPLWISALVQDEGNAEIPGLSSRTPGIMLDEER